MQHADGNKDTSTLALILAVGLLGMMGGVLMGPVLPALSDHFGVGGGSVGLVITVYAATTALFFPVMGYFTDRYGRRNVLVPALVINGVAGILGSVAPSFNFLLAARALQGVGIAGMAPMAVVLIGDLYEDVERAGAMGSLSSIRSAGGIISPLLGGTLATLSWNYPFAVYSLSIPLSLIFWSQFPFPDTHTTLSIREYLTPLARAVRGTGVQAVLVMSFLSFFLLYTVMTFIPQHLTSTYGLTEAQAGGFLAVQALATITLALQSGRLVQRVERRYLFGIGFVASGLGFLFLPTYGALLWIAISLVVYGFGRGLYQPQIITLVADVAPEGLLGGVSSANNIAKYAGQVAAPFLLGLVRSMAGFDTVFYVSGIMGLTAGLAILFMAFMCSPS